MRQTESAPWLDGYVHPLPIRTRRAFHLLSAKSAQDQSARVILLAGPSSDTAAVRTVLRAVQSAHERINDPRVPRVAESGIESATPYLAFACDAVCDGADILRYLGESDRKIDYAAADGFIASLRECMQSAHSEGLCLGRVSVGNTLFNGDGRWWLVGFGSNFPIEREHTLIDGNVTIFQAPELAGGGAPSPMGDYIALIFFMRSLLPFVRIEGTLARIFQGDVRPEDAAFLRALQWTEQRLLPALPQERPTMNEALAVAEEVRGYLGHGRDPEGFAALVRDLLREQQEQEAAAPPSASRTLLVAHDAAWIEGSDGVRRKLGTTLRRLLLALIERRGSACSVWQLLDAGWPGEQPIPEAGANRVYVTINRLRAMGAEGMIERFDDGYRIAPDVVVRAVN